jgi:hypothetical protein
MICNEVETESSGVRGICSGSNIRRTPKEHRESAIVILRSFFMKIICNVPSGIRIGKQAVDEKLMLGHVATCPMLGCCNMPQRLAY